MAAPRPGSPTRSSSAPPLYAACFIVIRVRRVPRGLTALHLGLVLFPVVIALFLTRVLSIPAGWLLAGPRRGGRRHHRWWRSCRPGRVHHPDRPADRGRVPRPGPTVDDGLSEIEDWLVEDSGFDVSRSDIEDAKDSLDERVNRVIEDSESEIARGRSWR